jgi:ribosomal protein S6
VKQKYESIVIFDGSLPDETVQKQSAAFEEFLKANTEFERVDAWGKKSLAYVINKKRTGAYFLYLFQDQSEKNISGKIDKFFQLNDAVVRHLTVVREEHKIIERKPRIPVPFDETSDREDN